MPHPATTAPPAPAAVPETAPAAEAGDDERPPSSSAEPRVPPSAPSDARPAAASNGAAAAEAAAASKPEASAATVASASDAPDATCKCKAGVCYQCRSPCRRCGCSCSREEQKERRRRQKKEAKARKKRKTADYTRVYEDEADPPTDEDDVLAYGDEEEEEDEEEEQPRAKKKRKTTKGGARRKASKGAAALKSSSWSEGKAKAKANAEKAEQDAKRKAEDRDARRRRQTLERQDAKFKERLEELRKFKEEKGHTNVSLTGSGNPKYKSLGSWVKYVRKGYAERERTGSTKVKGLTDENVASLEEMGFKWNGPQGSEATWEENLDKLTKYKERFGTTYVSHCSKEENPEMYSLGGWVRTQKYANRDGRLTAERKRKLDAIGFDFEIRGHGDINEQKWNRKFDKLREFHDVHGHTRVPNSHPDTELVHFYKRVRLTYSQMETHGLNDDGTGIAADGPKHKYVPLTADQIERLKSLNFDFTIRSDRKRKTWEERYQSLGEFFVEHGHCQVPCRYSKVLLLPRWVKEQKAEFRKLFEPGGQGKSKLTLDRYRRLEELGFQFVVEGEEEVERCAVPWSFCTCDFDGTSGSASSKTPKKKGGGKGVAGRKGNPRPWDDEPREEGGGAETPAAAAATTEGAAASAGAARAADGGEEGDRLV